MLKSFLNLLTVAFVVFGLTGCGKPKTAELEIPADNPYQITPDQQKAMDAGFSKAADQ